MRENNLKAIKYILAKQTLSVGQSSEDLATAILDSLSVDEEKVKEATIDLVDRHFPKYECKERGQAIVLYADMLFALATPEIIRIEQ